VQCGWKEANAELCAAELSSLINMLSNEDSGSTISRIHGEQAVVWLALCDSSGPILHCAMPCMHLWPLLWRYFHAHTEHWVSMQWCCCRCARYEGGAVCALLLGRVHPQLLDCSWAE
jgi:hypothetical protein